MIVYLGEKVALSDIAHAKPIIQGTDGTQRGKSGIFFEIKILCLNIYEWKSVIKSRSFKMEHSLPVSRESWEMLGSEQK